LDDLKSQSGELKNNLNAVNNKLAENEKNLDAVGTKFNHIKK
jgi:hypothetical protein